MHYLSLMYPGVFWSQYMHVCSAGSDDTTIFSEMAVPINTRHDMEQECDVSETYDVARIQAWVLVYMKGKSTIQSQ